MGQFAHSTTQFGRIQGDPGGDLRGSREWGSKICAVGSPATLELTPGPTGLTYISHKAARRQPKVGTDQATNVPVLVSSVSMFILLMQ